MQRARSARTIGDASNFQLPSRYQFQKLLGSGSYGVVASFRDATDGRDVAIKRVRRVFDNFLMLRRTLREIKLMRHFRHPNLLQLHDVLLVESGGELYISMELMDCDLDRLVRGRGIALEESKCRSYCSQVLLGLLHLHSAHVIHRDLKPANIFVRAQEVKIGDLGLSRGIAVNGDTGEATHPLEEHLTEYVVTRWYRAPEVLLARSKYGPKVDVWSVGCILFEMWTAKALFPGKNSLDQLSKVLGIMGIPSEEDQWWVPEESKPLLRCVSRVKSLSRMQGIPVGHGSDLLGRLLAFDPSKRLSVDAALQHAYLEGLSSAEQLERAKVVDPADVSYDQQYDGLSKGAEAEALSKLARMLRQEATPPRARRSLSRERLRRSKKDMAAPPDGPEAAGPLPPRCQEVVAADILPDAKSPSRARRSPAAAIPCALRSRAAWKKALVAAQQARALVPSERPPETALETSKTEEEINKELKKLQVLQEQQEKKLRRFLSAATPAGPRRSEPSLRATAASASDNARLEALDMPRASLFDQLLEDARSSRPSRPPRRKGQPQQSRSASPRQRRPSVNDTSPRGGDGRSVQASPKAARRRDTSRGTQVSQKAQAVKSKSPTAKGARPEKPTASQRPSDPPVHSLNARPNPFDAKLLRETHPGPKKEATSRPAASLQAICEQQRSNWQQLNEDVRTLPAPPEPDRADMLDSPLQRSSVAGKKSEFAIHVDDELNFAAPAPAW